MNQPEDQLARRMRALAVTLNATERAPMRLAGARPGALRRLALEVARYSDGPGAPAMEWLRDNVRAVGESALSLRKGAPLPASDGMPRVQHLARALVAGGDELVTLERVTKAVGAFDEIQPLTMRELWRIPEALRIELCQAFESVGRQVVSAQKERLLAEDWVQSGAKTAALRVQHSGAFYERALQLTHEQEMPAARRALDQWLGRHGEESDVVIRLEHERQALDKLWLSNIMAGFRMLEALDWASQYDQLCRAEKLLRLDPSGVYPRMDEESRSLIREEVARLARSTGQSELTLARRAVDEAAGLEGAQGTVCWWLYDDDGRRALVRALGQPNAPLNRMVPDPTGNRTALALSAGTLAILILLTAFLGNPLWIFPALPLSWRFAELIAGYAGARGLRPRKLLRLDMASVPDDARTLVCVPALLSGESRARALAEGFEALGALGTDPNVEYLLLCDFSDSPDREVPGEEALVSFLRSHVAQMNARAGANKYHYLQRERRFAQADQLWRGHERKRGAVKALNQLLLTGDEAQFTPERASAQYLYERDFRYVLTLDADTRALPDAVQKLIGAIAHPLNRPRIEDGTHKGYALIAPRVEQGCARSRFARLIGGEGGLDSYPVSASNLLMDASGRGAFPGKGVYDVRAFDQAAGKLPDNAILSHDLIEGLLAGAGLASDVAVYDDFPPSLPGYLKRLERWTRGDWQLVRFVKLAPDALGKWMLLSNLVRSLSPGAALLTLIVGLWSGNAAALLIGFAYAFLPALLPPSLPSIQRAAALLALLPSEALFTLSAAARALYRQFKTGRGLLEWVPAADAEGASGRDLSIVAARAAALLTLPALFNLPFLLPAAALAALFLVAPGWMRLLAQSAEGQALTDGQRDLLTGLARATWRFFESQTPEDGPGLPPDNLQLDPPVGKAPRTSPTNIGLYVIACASAHRMDIIGREELLRRLTRTVETLENLEKWHGHLYNWFDTGTLKPLRPRYVSSVDGGNLAACLLTAAQMIRPLDEALAGRLDSLARDMDFTKLYDKSRNLFHIGFDCERGILSSGHYDLLASESRILSFVSMALRQVPVKHWSKLGRGMARTGRHAALISWSGTMFEYLMPMLFVRAPKGSLLYGTERAVTAAQRSLGAPWGVSESGYNAFDLMMNYQYRAFGLPSLSLRGTAFERVIAPYASILALPVDPEAVLNNLESLQRAGFQGPMGLYEAIDYAPQRLPEGEPCRVVMSHMAHHQGMILASICNQLCDGALVNAFSGIPEVKALTLLLSEKPVRGAFRRAQSEPEPEEERPRQGVHAGCPAAGPGDAHLIYGGGTTAFLTASGAGFVRTKGILLNRWTARQGTDDGVWVHIKIPSRRLSFTASGVCPRMASCQRARFEAGCFSVLTKTDELECRMTACVSPEDGALIQRLELTSHAAQPLDVEVTGCFKVALSAEADMRAHPAFQNLFVRARLEEGALVFTRKPRQGGSHPLLLYQMAGADDLKTSHEIDLEKLTGREGALSDPDSLERMFSNASGATLNPCAAIRARLTLAPGGRRQLAFVAGLADDPEALSKMRARHAAPEDTRRSLLLSGSQARSMLDFLSLAPARHQLLQRASRLLMFPKRGTAQPSCRLNASGLWALGISGDLPLISVRVSSTQQMALVKDALRAHEFYRAMGVWCDLVLINDYGNDYEQPVRDSLRDQVAASHLADMVLEPGGAFLLEGATLTAAQRALLEAVSSIFLDGSEPLDAGIRALLRALPEPQETPKARLRGGFSLPEEPREKFNGWGGFSKGGYVIDLMPGRPTPAPWCNMLVNAGGFGSLVSERGGGFTFAKNSRGMRLTPFTNDPLREGEGEKLILSDGRAYASLLPEQRGLMQPFRVEHRPGVSRFASGAGTLNWTIETFVDCDLPVKCLMLTLHNAGGLARSLKLTAAVDWLMGVDSGDARLACAFPDPPMVVASGSMEGFGFAALLTYEGRAPEGLEADPAGMTAPLSLPPGGSARLQFLLGWAAAREGCREALSAWGDGGARLARAREKWEELLSRVVPETGDALTDQMLGRWLPAQALAGRVWGRVGLYQAGGAFGFRDQLQDMLALIPIEPQLVRAHLMTCAARQFEAGDVLHWWHPERTGVRTRISDDLLFLPYVAAAYVSETGDSGVLREEAPYLQDVAIPEDDDDWYGTPEVSPLVESLDGHCMRAFRRAASMTGAHGLPLMGAGDWNDGMNLVGAGGGESVWLGQFLSVAAEDYARVTEPAEQKEELKSLAARMREAVEASGWDGAWYRRAWYADGAPLGSNSSEGGCRIDLIAQCWAVAAGLDRERCRQAMDSAWSQLYDPDNKLIKLLTPPLTDSPRDPGYIARYPAGIRENGGQYTHASCWAVMAFALLGDAERAWQALDALLPMNHADTEEGALKYRVEPYVMAGDVYGEAPFSGRGGWSWYTGSASWLCRAAIKYLLGYERQGNRAKLSALLRPGREEAALTVRMGASSYRLRCLKGQEGVTLDGRVLDGDFIDLIDDGRAHEAIFPERKPL